MTTIYFVRHGLVHNPKKIWYGRIPGYHLGETGKEQARHAGELLSGRSIQAMYSSPLERTMETSKIIADTIGIDAIHEDDRLLEIFSPLQGCPESDMEKIRWNHYSKDLLSRGGETIDDMIRRLKDFYFEKSRIHDGQRIIVVSHGEPMMITFLLSQGIVPTYKAIQTVMYLPTGSAMELMIDPDTKSIRLVRVF